METKLAPIFKLRIICLKQTNPQYYETHKKQIRNSSLAAQDYVLSGKIYEYRPYMEKNFKELPEYIKIHKKYSLPFKPDEIILTNNDVNSGLVMDLSWSFEKDRTHLIIDEKGNIINPEKIYDSEVLKVYHNSNASGIPADALKEISPTAIIKIIKTAQKTK